MASIRGRGAEVDGRVDVPEHVGQRALLHVVHQHGAQRAAGCDQPPDGERALRHQEPGGAGRPLDLAPAPGRVDGGEVGEAWVGGIVDGNRHPGILAYDRPS